MKKYFSLLITTLLLFTLSVEATASLRGQGGRRLANYETPAMYLASFGEGGANEGVEDKILVIGGGLAYDDHVVISAGNVFLPQIYTDRDRMRFYPFNAYLVDLTGFYHYDLNPDSLNAIDHPLSHSDLRADINIPNGKINISQTLYDIENITVNRIIYDSGREVNRLVNWSNSPRWREERAYWGFPKDFENKFQYVVCEYLPFSIFNNQTALQNISSFLSEGGTLVLNVLTSMQLIEITGSISNFERAPFTRVDTEDLILFYNPQTTNVFSFKIYFKKKKMGITSKLMYKIAGETIITPMLQKTGLFRLFDRVEFVDAVPEWYSSSCNDGYCIAYKPRDD